MSKQVAATGEVAALSRAEMQAKLAFLERQADEQASRHLMLENLIKQIVPQGTSASILHSRSFLRASFWLICWTTVTHAITDAAEDTDEEDLAINAKAINGDISGLWNKMTRGKDLQFQLSDQEMQSKITDLEHHMDKQAARQLAMETQVNQLVAHRTSISTLNSRIFLLLPAFADSLDNSTTVEHPGCGLK